MTFIESINYYFISVFPILSLKYPCYVSFSINKESGNAIDARFICTCSRLIDSLFGDCEGLHTGNQAASGLLSRRYRLILLQLNQVKIFIMLNSYASIYFINANLL